MAVPAGRPKDMILRPGFVPLTAAAAFLAILPACFVPHTATARGPRQPCIPSAESVVMDAARNAVADRFAEDRHRFPWSDTTPPTPIDDAAVCERAAKVYERAAAPQDRHGRPPRRAGVVRAGGLYFVVSPPAHQAGEFMIVGVLDAEFRWLVGLTM
jgi:hypothetical protein